MRFSDLKFFVPLIVILILGTCILYSLSHTNNVIQNHYVENTVYVGDDFFIVLRCPSENFEKHTNAFFIGSGQCESVIKYN